jgi:hypothetical protein
LTARSNANHASCSRTEFLTYPELVAWTGSEWIAGVLARHFDYRNLTEHDLAKEVVGAMMGVKDHPAKLEILSAYRRAKARGAWWKE